MPQTERILVVDDESGMRIGLTETLERGGFAVTAVDGGAAALAALERGGYVLVLCDMRMPSMGGGDLLVAVQARHPGLPMVMMTAYGTVEDAVAAMKAGARDFLTKPFSPHDLLHLVRGILRDARERAPEPDGRGGALHRQLITRSPAMRRVLAIAEGVAASRAPVLIQGESGTGKELLARHIHASGPRRQQAFVAVNCAALPRELLESELFGHERGAFTGAIARKLGKFELANGGTILLDEISELELPLQAKLLRVLQEHEIDRVGGTRPVAIDARVIATANRPLGPLVAAAAFRRDLYYRLHVIPLTVPPLRERGEDVEVLIDHFCERFRGGRALTIEPAARVYLRRHAWPGNVRELEHVLERAALLAAGTTIALGDVALEDELTMERPAALSEAGGGDFAGLTVHEMERRLILDTLQRTKNNRSHAAKVLGISVRTLRNKLAEYRTNKQIDAAL
ncbi:MAG: sigma-54-dependent Fis family transcriptional regulator [Deltaproteobacteria bacterium]|nr:sigma-54-dependent Fis family transcriptional regulator [Deltaproteobacteria bacterium]